MEAFVGIVIVLVLITLFIIGWVLNRRIPVPEDAKDSIAKCSSCHQTSCGMHPNQRGDKNE